MAKSGPANKQEVANYIRAQYGIPLSASDDDVINYAHAADPQGMEEFTRNILTPPPALPIGEQGETGPVQTSARLGDVISSIGSGLGAADKYASSALASIPGIGPLLSKAAQFGKKTVSETQQGAEDIAQNAGPLAGLAAKTGALATSMTFPQSEAGVAGTALSAMAPGLSKASRAASEALAPAEGIVGGPLASGKTLNTLGAIGKVASGTPELNIKAALEDPSILLGDKSVEQAGEDINVWGAKMGVKTGAEARGAIPGVNAKAIPKLSSGEPFADKVYSDIDQYEQRAQQRASQISLHQDYIKNADQIAKDAGLSPSAQDMENMASTPGASGGQSPADKIRKFAATQIGGFQQQAQQDLQDLISARNVMGKLRGKPMFLAPQEAEDSYLASQHLNRVDKAIQSTAESILPGSSDEYAGLVDEYHRAKVRESFSPLMAQNANGSPSVLRAWAAASPLLRGNPAGIFTMAAQSPAMAARAIRAAAFMRDFNATAPSDALGALSDLMSAVPSPLAAGISNAASNLKDNEVYSNGPELK